MNKGKEKISGMTAQEELKNQIVRTQLVLERIKKFFELEVDNWETSKDIEKTNETNLKKLHDLSNSWIEFNKNANGKLKTELEKNLANSLLLRGKTKKGWFSKGQSSSEPKEKVSELVSTLTELKKKIVEFEIKKRKDYTRIFGVGKDYEKLPILAFDALHPTIQKQQKKKKNSPYPP